MAREFVKSYGAIKVNSSMGSNLERPDDQGDPRNSSATGASFEPDGGRVMVFAPYVRSHSLQEGLPSMSSWSRTGSTKKEAEVSVHV